MANVISTRASGAGFLDRTAAAASAFRAAMERRRLYRRTYGELSALSARELADLGILRADIDAIAREAAYGG